MTLLQQGGKHILSQTAAKRTTWKTGNPPGNVWQSVKRTIIHSWLKAWGNCMRHLNNITEKNRTSWFSRIINFIIAEKITSWNKCKKSIIWILLNWFVPRAPSELPTVIIIKLRGHKCSKMKLLVCFHLLGFTVITVRLMKELPGCLWSCRTKDGQENILERLLMIVWLF